MKKFIIQPNKKSIFISVGYLFFSIVFTTITFVNLFMQNTHTPISRRLTGTTAIILSLVILCLYKSVKEYIKYMKFRILIDESEITYSYLNRKVKFTKSDIRSIALMERDGDFNIIRGENPGIKVVSHRFRWLSKFQSKYSVNIFLFNGDRFAFPYEYQNTDVFIYQFRDEKNSYIERLI